MNKVANLMGWIGVAMAAVLVGGCATPGYQKAGQSAGTMNQTKAEVQEAFGQVTYAIRSLDSVMNAQVGDLRPMYEDFVSQVKVLESAAGMSRNRALSMQAKNQQYFASWAQEIETIQDPAIKAQSLGRYRQALASYQKVEQMLMKTRDAYVPMIKGLSDLQIAMNLDLNPASISALRPSYNKTRKQAIELQNVMTATMAAIDNAAGHLTPQASGML